VATTLFPADYFQRQDPSDDSYFYSSPRLVVHIDDHAITALGSVFIDLLPAGGTYLDLMSSWRSHYPPELKPVRMVGLGMNAQEMEANPQLDKHVVQNLNVNPILPYENDLFDAVTCTVSVQYLTKPVEVFSEVRRVLKPDGIFVVSFSNRCFPNKAVAIWLSTNDRQHLALVKQYFELSGKWDNLTAQQTDPQDGYPHNADPLYVVWGRKAKM
jgi:SAM-dependent methyltransferase